MDRLSNRRRFLKRGALFVPAAFGILRAQNIMPGPIMRPMAAAGGPSYLLEENLEDASVGWDNNNANSWTNSGACNPTYDVAPAPLVGDHSLRIPAGEYCWAPHTGQTELYYYCLFHLVSVTSSSRVMDLRDSGGTAVCYFIIDTDNSNRLQLHCGTSNQRTNNGITTGTTYSLWAHYKKGTGADAVADVEWQEAGTARSGSGNNYASIPDGSSTADAARLYFNNDGTEVYIIDTIKVTTGGYHVP